MRIGYQGDFGSNSYYVAKEYDGSSELVPLICSERVLSALDSGEIDLGVVAVKNSLGGTVIETSNALNKHGDHYVKLAEINVPIHHCLFKTAGVGNDEIKHIVSHIQALSQTGKFINENFSCAVSVEAADTALAAADLAAGKYSRDCAVICRKECGFHYGLELISENIEDSEDNVTTFVILRCASASTSCTSDFPIL